jgi:hypothetical protein
MESSSLWVLLVSTFTIGVVHALAPDHWVPFVSIGKAQGWSRTRLSWVTVLSGIGHVGSSVVIGLIGLGLGFGLTHLKAVESQRGEIAGLLLIGFGLAYGVWGLKQARHHHHRKLDPKRTVTVWALFAIFVLGPCEPLIPLMFLAAAHGWHAVLLVTALFSLVTIGMMLGQALLGYIGVSLLPAHSLDRYSHVLAGGVIAATGAMVMFLGI